MQPKIFKKQYPSLNPNDAQLLCSLIDKLNEFGVKTVRPLQLSNNTYFKEVNDGQEIHFPFIDPDNCKINHGDEPKRAENLSLILSSLLKVNKLELDSEYGRIPLLSKDFKSMLLKNSARFGAKDKCNDFFNYLDIFLTPYLPFMEVRYIH